MLSMRPAFEESVLEASEPLRHPRHHRLRKIVAQIAFGLYLLRDGLAKNESTVIRILQGHINDINEFLKRTTEEFENAADDISERIGNLKVPLDEKGGVAEVFEKMLESRGFRREMAEKNEKVEFVVKKTTDMMKERLKDVDEGLKAVEELARYLLAVEDGWAKFHLVRVYEAMKHNCTLWFRCYLGLQAKGSRLGERLYQLLEMVREIDKRTAAASKKVKVGNRHFGGGKR